jgi:hypothetical protein
MKMDRRNGIGKIIFKFSKRNPCIETDEDLDLLTDKGVYPCNYFTSFDKFREKQLPPKRGILQ